MIDDNGRDEQDWGEPEEAAGSEDEQAQEFAAAASSQDRSRRPSILVPVLLVVLTLGIVFAAGAGLKLQNDKAQIAAAMGDSLRLLELAGPEGASRQQLAAAASALEAGRYEDVKQLMARLQAPTGPAEAPSILPDAPGLDGDSPKLPPEAYANLPEGAVAYFRQREDLLRAFLEECNYSRQLRDAGVDVDDLRAVRDSLIEAARLGQDEKVRTLLAKMQKMVRGKGGGPEPGLPEELREGLEEFRDVAEEANRQGRDVRPAMELVQRAEALAAEGKMDEAKAAIQRAIKAAQSAKKGQERRQLGRRPMRPRTPQGRRPARAPGAEGGFPPFLLQGLLGMVAAEEADLTYAYEKINSAMVAIREKNAEQIKEILDEALGHFSTIGKRRHEFSTMLNELTTGRREGMERQGRRGERPGGERPGGRGPMPDDRMQQVREALTASLVDALQRARGLSDEQFEQRKEAIAEQLVMAMTDGRRPQPPGGAEAEGQPDAAALIKGYETEMEKAEAEQRIRDKMQAAQEPYSQLREAGEDGELVAELERLFALAREALYVGDYLEAEELVNEGLRKLGIEVEPLPELDEVQEPPA